GVGPGGAGRHSRLGEDPGLAAGRERRREEAAGARRDRARAPLAHDPARGARVGRDDIGLEAEIRDQLLGGGVRAERVRPRLEREAALAERLHRAAEAACTLEDERLARVLPFRAPERGDEARDTPAQDDGALHPSAVPTTLA